MNGHILPTEWKEPYYVESLITGKYMHKVFPQYSMPIMSNAFPHVAVNFRKSNG